MKHILSADGDHALCAALRRQPVLAFDYDGTLAPITLHHSQTITPPAITSALTRLGSTLPVIIVTGRSVADASRRLAVPGARIIGNHGAEGLPTVDTGAFRQQVVHWHALILSQFGEQMHQAGVLLENKGCSLSLHFRQAPDTAEALRLVDEISARLPPGARISSGKRVRNIVPADAPDKADALLGIAATMANQGELPTAIYVGDDENDEAVFRRAPADWLTIRVGASQATAARYFLHDQTEILPLLHRILAHLPNLQPWLGKHTPPT